MLSIQRKFQIDLTNILTVIHSYVPLHMPLMKT